MSKIYIVLEHYNDIPIGVFSTREKAIEYIKFYYKESTHPQQYWSYLSIAAFELDKFYENSSEGDREKEDSIEEVDMRPEVGEDD